MFIAHTRIEDNVHQPLKEHLYGTAEQAKVFGKAFNNGEYAYLCGLLHDLGKYSSEFQKRILHGGPKCDHSSAGARLIYNYKPFGILISYCVAGHHSGLLDSGSRTDIGGEGTLYGRLSEDNTIPDFRMYKQELDLLELKLDKPNLKPLNKGGFSVAFFIRMLFSALVDADYLDTEKFMTNGKIDRNINYDFNKFVASLKQYIGKFSNTGTINKKRSEILNSCIQKAKSPRGLFTLTVPTGGGKTVSSMAFAIRHLIENKMDRIIYVIPYTSIIEQNANVFRDIFGDDVVLEHHSNFDFLSKEDESYNNNKLYLSTENWDIPIIVTTNVQFFESLFSNKSSKCRKIHNVANSVIIFDEVQMLPVNYLTLCVNAIAELVHNYNSTAVLCSATQPAITKMFPKEIKEKPIIENTYELYKAFSRTKIINRGELSDEKLAEEINKLDQVLCIVNTRRHALNLYRKLHGEGNYHLSTLMCPAHRKAVLSEIRKRLVNEQPCRVISTRLIEAGVDVDFPIVYREIAGLDSIVQAAGRCNREGKLTDDRGYKKFGEVHVFIPEEEFGKRQPVSFKREIEITKKIFSNHKDIMSPDAITDYFEELYYYLGDEGLDVHGLYRMIEAGALNASFEFPFKTIAETFKIIEDNNYSILIPYNDFAKEKIESLRYVDFIGSLLRSLQSYTVNIYEYEYQQLLGSGKLRQIKEGIMELISLEDYDEFTGLKIDSEGGIGIYL